MSELTKILHATAQGDSGAARKLLPLVYNELRQLAARKLAQESGTQTLQPTALVHEAWLRLGGDEQPTWENRTEVVNPNGVAAAPTGPRGRNPVGVADFIPAITQGGSSRATLGLEDTIPLGLKTRVRSSVHGRSRVSLSSALEASTPTVFPALLRPRTGALRQLRRRDPTDFSIRL